MNKVLIPFVNLEFLDGNSCGEGSFTTFLLPLAAAAAKLLQSGLTLCNPIDGSPPGSSVPGILQARILEWVAISFSILLLEGMLISIKYLLAIYRVLRLGCPVW